MKKFIEKFTNIMLFMFIVLFPILFVIGLGVVVWFAPIPKIFCIIIDCMCLVWIYEFYIKEIKNEK